MVTLPTGTNNGFDWRFINWYFHHLTGANPLGLSSTNLASLYEGLVRDTAENFTRLRKTRHTRHLMDDLQKMAGRGCRCGRG